MKENILVSACLLGFGCRYDGKCKDPDKNVLELRERFNLIPVCAEDLGGLSVPRLGAEIQGDKVIRQDGVDVTKEYNLGADKVLSTARKYNCRIAVLKSKSPSCGNKQIYDGTFSRTLIEGKGKTAELLERNGIKVYNENEIKSIIGE